MTGRRWIPRSLVGLAASLVFATGDAGAQPGSSPPTIPPVSGGGPLPAPQLIPSVPAPQPGGSTPPGLPGGQPGNFGGVAPNIGPGQPTPFPLPQRFPIKIEPNTPAKDLLPAPPASVLVGGPLLTDDLAKVPEAEFQARPENAHDGKQAERAAHQLARISHLNAKKTDAFMTALLESRPDLAGLPFSMGDDCRTTGERTKQFTIAVNTVRQALNGGRNPLLPQGPFTGPGGGPVPPAPPGAQAPPAPLGSFWTQYASLCEQEDAGRSHTDKAMADHVTLARIAALMQMLAAESPEIRLGLVKYLSGVSHTEATKALARLAIFSREDDIRLAAADALKVRRDRDYTDVLVKGLRYPWPAVAKRTAELITRVGREDMIPELLAVLESSDPRLPTTKEVGGKKVTVVREMVKINHHRNCMMCHAPGNPDTTTGSMILAEVAVPGQPLPLPAEGYRQSSPDLMIRIDVTYLRQDFSAMLPVDGSHPWPESQRFDFMVRERRLTPEEKAVYQDKLTPTEPGVLSPYHRAALAALRDLTGKDAAPTAEAWRKLLGIPAKG
jgi:hypothetical protein